VGGVEGLMRLRMHWLKYKSSVALFILNKKLFPHDVSRVALPSLGSLNLWVWEKKPQVFFHKIQFEMKKTIDSKMGT